MNIREWPSLDGLDIAYFVPEATWPHDVSEPWIDMADAWEISHTRTVIVIISRTRTNRISNIV